MFFFFDALDYQVHSKLTSCIEMSFITWQHKFIYFEEIFAEKKC